MLARGKLVFIKQSSSEFYWSKVHDTHDVYCDNKEGEPPRRWYGNTNFGPPYLKVLPTPLVVTPIANGTEGLGFIGSVRVRRIVVHGSPPYDVSSELSALHSSMWYCKYNKIWFNPDALSYCCEVLSKTCTYMRYFLFVFIFCLRYFTVFLCRSAPN